METSEILKRVRQIEIKTRGLSNNIFAGEYHSAFKGRGMAFSEVREYQYGDDIRDIEWNVTARFNKPYVKVFEEERELTVMLMVDVSGSLNFGTQKQMKRDMLTEIGATLAFSAIQNNDKIGVIFFSDKIEKFIPPKKGRKHILYIIRELLDFQPESQRTDIRGAIEYLTRVIKRRCTAFLLSDFLDKGEFRQTLTIANRKHDIVAIQVYDRRLAELPDVGLMKMKDNETGQEIIVDTSSKQVRREHALWWKNQKERLADTFNRSRGNVNPTVFNIEKDGMNNADHIITVSNLTRRTVIEKYGISPDKVTTVHNAVEPLSQELLNVEVPPKHDKVVTFLGRITMQKGPEYFVEAAAQVLSKVRGVQFVMAGGGDMMEKMIRLAARRGISDRFHFAGFLRGKEVYEMLKASDVYIMPSVSEPFGISPLEAMQMGVPSIISKQSGCAEILSNVIKVDYWDTNAIADAIYSIIKYPAMYKELREKGLEEVNQIVWKKAGAKVIDIYNKLLNR